MSTDAEVLRYVRQAFRETPRPKRYTPCNCEECRKLSSTLKRRDNETLTAHDLDLSTALLSPQAFRYFTPAFVRMCLSNKHADQDLAEFYVSDLCVPVSRTDPPTHHPKAIDFDYKQTLAVFKFLRYFRDMQEDTLPARSRMLARGIRNWTYFLSNLDRAVDLP